MDKPPSRVGDKGSGISGGATLRLPPPEHGLTVHCNQAHYGHVSVSEEETGAKDIQAVVGTRIMDVEVMCTDA